MTLARSEGDTASGRKVIGLAVPGKPHIHALAPIELTDGSDPLLTSLAALVATRSESHLLTLLDEAASRHFGAMRAILLSREPALMSTHRVVRLAGSAAATSVQVRRPEVEARLKAGTPFVTDAPWTTLPEVPIPAGAGRAVLVPCCGEGSMNAVCAFWAAGEPPLAASELDRFRLLATTAGLVFDRHISELRGRILRADLDNRIRNVLAVIRSVGTRSAERAASMEDFLLHYEGRIDAIGRSQIAAGRHGEISFELLLREELLAQAVQDEPHVSLEGMDVAITSEQAEALGLAMHELAVNAVKFGALAGPGGSLAVRWWVESRAESLALNIDWRERCGPFAINGRPDRAGFGLTYLEHALPFQLNAEVTLGFLRQGLRCQIAVPLHGTPDLRVELVPDAPARERLPAPPERSGRSGDNRCKIDLVRK